MLSLALAAASVSAQVMSQDSVSINIQRSMVTRAELQQALSTAERDMSSSGYSQGLRDIRRTEADAIRNRLENGDILPGDKLAVQVLQNGPYSKEYLVSPNRTITLPNGKEISVAHILRSELSDSLRARLIRLDIFTDPRVIATASIRIQLSGAIGQNGFFWAPASDLLSTVLMERGGGPGRDSDLPKSEVRRADKVIVTGPDFQAALREGRSLDQLNVQAGDEIHIAEKPSSSTLVKALAIAGSLASVIFLVRSIF